MYVLLGFVVCFLREKEKTRSHDIVKRQEGEKCEKILYKNANKREDGEIGLLKIHIINVSKIGVFLKV